MTIEKLYELDVQAAVAHTLEQTGELFLHHMRLRKVSEVLAMDERDILADFALFLLAKEARPIYAYQGKAKFEVYMLVIFRNWLSDYIKRKKSESRRQVATSISEQERKEWEAKDNPAVRYIEQETEGRKMELVMFLFECMGHLGRKWERYIWDIFNKKLTIKEAAIQENKSYGSFYYSVKQNLERLRHCLEKQGVSQKELPELFKEES